MSYVEFGTLVAQRTISVCSFAHQHMYPLCWDLVQSTSEQWSPLKTIVSVVGATSLTYLLEAIFVYCGLRLGVFAVRLFSNTLYRILRFALTVVLVSALVLFGIYYYFTSTPTGQELLVAKSRGFFVDQAMELASRLQLVFEAQRTASAVPGLNNPF
ncbi:hypothetical protein EC988_005643 [Linderina pennispora]|nr:hypothetical protein EC988_005643 [Linderina pennispora]